MITGSERAIRYSELGRVLQEYQPEILLLPANWEFNFPLVENIIEIIITKKAVLIRNFFATFIYHLPYWYESVNILMLISSVANFPEIVYA